MLGFLTRPKIEPKLSQRQSAISKAGRLALEKMEGKTCADVWDHLLAGPWRGVAKPVRLSEYGEMVGALYHYADYIQSSKHPVDETTSRVIQAVLARPFRLERAVATYAETVKSPHAERCKSPRTVATFAGLVLALKTMRDRPDLLIE